MASDTQTFHPFPRLPLELQFRVWKESIKQSSPRVFELYRYDPVLETMEEDYDSDSDWSDSLEKPPFNAPRRMKIADITLYERSVSFQRPLLEVDRTSRKENICHYCLVKFLNAHVRMDMDIDVIFLGQFQKILLDHRMSLSRNATIYGDPFWKTVKHLAFGMMKVLDMLEKYEGGFDENDEMEPAIVGCVGELQQFPALETFTLVLDGTEHRRRKPRVSGTITFGETEQVTQKIGGPPPMWHVKWMRYFLKEWDGVRIKNPEWNVPILHIKSISRGGKLQQPAWDWRSGYGLPSFLLREKRARNRLEDEQDDDLLGLNSGSETDESEGSGRESESADSD